MNPTRPTAEIDLTEAYGLKFGLDVATTGKFADVRLLADLAAEAEAAGWDGFFLWDVLFAGGDASSAEPVADPWVALTAVALATTRLRIGAFMTPLARRRPWHVARTLATLDHLSGGRMILGAGLGYRADEFSRVGEDATPIVRAQKLDESLAIIDGLWKGQPMDYSGVHYQLEGPVLLPGPVQVPRIPIWTAAGWPRRRPLNARQNGTARIS